MFRSIMIERLIIFGSGIVIGSLATAGAILLVAEYACGVVR